MSSPDWRDLSLVLLVFWTPALGIYLTFIGRELILLRRSLRLLKLELRTSSAEGFPPPGPPTTDSLSDTSDTLEPPRQEKPDPRV